MAVSKSRERGGRDCILVVGRAVGTVQQAEPCLAQRRFGVSVGEQDNCYMVSW